MKRFWFFTLGLLFILAACTPQPSAAPAATIVPPTDTAKPPTAAPTPASSFNYDPSVPFDTRIISQTEQSGVTVTQLSYTAHDPSFGMGGRTVATLVSPRGNGPFAGIVHLLSGRCATYPIGSQEYLAEAIAMAQHGAVTLLAKDYFPTNSQPFGTQDDHSLVISQVIEIRRAFDFLLAQPGVDPKRLGYVGEDGDGVYGGILAGVDKRAKAYVLVAGYPSIGEFLISIAVDPSDPNQYMGFFQDIDPINFVPHAAPASLFFQFAKNDNKGLTENLANQYYAAASQPKQIKWYDDNHYMKSDPVLKDRQAWLIDQLALAP